MEFVVLAEFVTECDVRRVLAALEEGVLTLREDLDGPTAQLVYGEPSVSLRARVSAREVARLLEQPAVREDPSVLADLFATDEFDITDFLDLCDEGDVPYTFQSLGAHGVLNLRP